MSAQFAAMVATQQNGDAAVEATSHADRIIGQALERSGSGFLATGSSPMLDALIELERHEELAAFLPLAREQVRTNELVRPVVARAEAMLILRSSDTDGRVADAERLLRSALEGFRELSAQFEVARTSELLGTLVASPEREELLRVSLDTFEDLGAVPYARSSPSRSFRG